MRIALDTNVLLRAILRDDPTQTEVAENALRRGDELVISLISLCELAWVLRSRGASRREIHSSISALLSLTHLEIDRAAVQMGLRFLEEGGDFADGCIMGLARAARCDWLVSFDEGILGRAAGFAVHPATLAQDPMSQA